MSKCEKCDAHEYLEQTLGELKHVDEGVSEILTEVRISIAKLTENLEETRRTNRRLEEILKRTDEKIETTTTAFKVFKTRMYAYGSGAVASGGLLGYLAEKILKLLN